MLMYVIGGHPEDPESFALAILVCVLIVLEVLIAVVQSI